MSFELVKTVRVALLTLSAMAENYEDVHVTLYRGAAKLGQCETYAWEDEDTCANTNCNTQNVTLVCDRVMANRVNLTMDYRVGQYTSKKRTSGTNLQVFAVKVRGDNCKFLFQ